MAEAYLEGGPCDGKTRKIPTTDAGVVLACGGHTYVITDPVRHRKNGNVIFKDAGPTNPPNPAPSGKVKAPKSLDGWTALRKSINRGMPETLRYAQRVNRQTLRTLSRTRKVRV